MAEDNSSSKLTTKHSKRRCTTCYFIVCLMLAILLTGLVLFLFWTPIYALFDSSTKNNVTFCISNKDAPDVPTTSTNLSELVDLNANPCQDFYAFACGLQKPIKPKCSIFSDKKQIQKLGEKMGMFGSRDVINQCLNESIYGNSHNGSTAIQKFYLFRDAYVKNSANKDLTVDQLVQNIKSFGGCPAISSTQWNPNNFNLTYTLQRLTNLTTEMHLFKWWANRLENSTFVLTIDAEQATSFQFDNDQMNMLALALELLNTVDGSKNNDVNYTTIASEIMGLYDEIIEVYVKFNESDTEKEDEYGFKIPPKMDANLEPVKFDEINQLLPIVGTRYFTDNVHVFPQLRSHLSKNPYIYLDKKQLLLDLNEFYTQLEPDQMANFLCSQYLIGELKYLDLKPLEKTYPQLVNDLSDQIEETDDNDLLESMTDEFPTVVDHLFISHCVSPDTYDRIRLMLNEIKLIVYQTIQRQSWMDMQSKDILLRKLNKMKINILGVDLVRDVKKLDSFYDILKFDQNDSLREMSLKLNLLMYRRMIEMAFNDTYNDLTEVATYRASVTNAAHLPLLNSLSIYAGILFPPSYKSNRLDALNYGAIGSTIGHEFSHAFHLLGQKFGAIGERKQLFTQQTTNNFMNRIKCFIDQYSQYEDKEVGEFIKGEGASFAKNFDSKNNTFGASSKLNGSRVLEENLADNFGVRLAFEAYKVHLHGRVESPLEELPQFTNDQLFFLSYGSIWCNSYSVLERFLLLVDDNHSPGKARINMVMQNFRPFANAFNCPVGSPMNPVNKCQMWE